MPAVASRPSWPRTRAASTAGSPTTCAATSASTPPLCAPASTTTSRGSRWRWKHCERPGSGRAFMVAENAQYWPEVLTVRDRIRDGAIGNVITARAATFFPPLGDFYGGDQPWRFDRAAAGGGVVIDTGSHWLRPLRMWLGEV